MNSALNEKNIIDLSLSAFALAFSLGAAYFDLKSRKIPNKYNLAGLIAGSVIRIGLAFVNFGYFIAGISGLAAGFFIFFPFFLIRKAGAGDIKLLSVLGIILGLKAFSWIFLLTMLWDGGILFPLRYLKTLYLFMKLPFPMESKMQNIFSHLQSLKRSTMKPFALPVSLACLTYLLIYLFCRETIEDWAMKNSFSPLWMNNFKNWLCSFSSAY